MNLFLSSQQSRTAVIISLRSHWGTPSPLIIHDVLLLTCLFTSFSKMFIQLQNVQKISIFENLVVQESSTASYETAKLNRRQGISLYSLSLLPLWSFFKIKCKQTRKHSQPQLDAVSSQERNYSWFFWCLELEPIFLWEIWCSSQTWDHIKTAHKFRSWLYLWSRFHQKCKIRVKFPLLHQFGDLSAKWHVSCWVS